MVDLEKSTVSPIGEVKRGKSSFPALFETSDMKQGINKAVRKFLIKGIGIDTWGVDFGW